MQTSRLVFTTKTINEYGKEVTTELFLVNENRNCFFVTDNEDQIEESLMNDYFFGTPSKRALAAFLLQAIKNCGFKTFDDI